MTAKEKPKIDACGRQWFWNIQASLCPCEFLLAEVLLCFAASNLPLFLPAPQGKQAFHLSPARCVLFHRCQPYSSHDQLSKQLA